MKTVHTAFDINENRNVMIEVGQEIRSAVLDVGNPTGCTIYELAEADPDFDNRYMDIQDRFLDGNNLYADGVEYREYNCEGYIVRFERDAKIFMEVAK